MHERFSALLDELLGRGRADEVPAVGQDFLGEILHRVMLMAPSETSRLEIAAGRSNGSNGFYWHIPQGTVSKAVKVLLSAGMLEDGERLLRTQDGRVLAPLRLGRGWCVAGSKVVLQKGCPRTVTTALFSLDGETVLRRSTVDLEETGIAAWHDLARIIHSEVVKLRDMHGRARRRAGTEPLRLFGLGVEVGAHVHDGAVVRPPMSESLFERIPLAESLDELFDHSMPVIVENDVNALAVLATQHAAFPEADLVVVAVFDEGVGGGLVMDGRLRRGGSGMAMEIGHLTVGHAPGEREATGGVDRSLSDFDPLCSCGILGHLDAFATPFRIRKALAAGSLQQVASAPAQADGQAESAEFHVLRKAGAVLGRGLAHVINTVNPSRLLLYLPSELANTHAGTAGPAYLAAVEDEVHRAYSTGGRDARLDVQRLPADINILGARASAVSVFNGFIEHARGIDGCPVPQRRNRQRKGVTADGQHIQDDKPPGNA